MIILLIEDDKRLAEFLSYSLSGDTVLVAHSLAAAHSILLSKRPNLMVVDLNLPDSVGLDTLAALRPYVCPRIVLTASGKDLACQAAALGASDYIEKTTSSMDSLVDRIKFNLSKYRPRARFEAGVFREICAHLTTRHTLLSA